MNFYETGLRLGDAPNSLGQILLFLAGLALALIAAAAIFAFRAQSGRRRDTEAQAERAYELELRLAEMAGSLKSFADMAQGSQAELGRTLEERLDAVNE